MTNAELIQAIKAEIERRIKECEATYPKDKGGYWFPEQEEAYAIAEEYKQLLSFLSTIEESEKPMNQEGLDEELINEADRKFFRMAFYEGNNHELLLDCVSLEEFRGIARHFAKWGADHTHLPEDTVLFNKGMEEGKRLMLEEAVEGVIAGDGQHCWIDAGIPMSWKYQSKVHIIKID